MRKHTETMSAAAYLESQKKKPSKYLNKKVLHDGIWFDSQLECKRYKELRLLERGGRIQNLQLQVRYELQPAFRYKGKAIRAITYLADFQYVENGVLVVEDTKGMVTKEFAIKEKLFKHRYPDIDFRLITR